MASKNFTLSQVGNVLTTDANGVITSMNTSSMSANLGAVGNITITGGSAGQYLQTNGNGTLSWNTVVTNNVANANYSAYTGNVTIAAQPNITSVGNLSGLTVTGTTNLGAVGNITITGGSNGQVLTTNGSGGLSWAAAGGGSGGSANAFYATSMGNIGSTEINAGSVTFNTILNSGYPWLSIGSRYGVGTNYGLYINSRNLSGAGAGVWSGTYGSQIMPAANTLLLNYYTSAGASFEIRNVITGEAWSIDLIADQIGWGIGTSLNVRIPNPVDPTAMNSVIAALLTTNQAAFNSAAAGVAVEITAAEYAALVAGVPNTTKFGATDAIMATVPGVGDGNSSGQYADGDHAVEAQAPAQRYIYAFTTRVVTVDSGSTGQLFVHTSQATGNNSTASLYQVHNNAITISNTTTQRYWVVKNAQYRRLACYAANWCSVNHWKFTGAVSGSYKYLSTTGPANGTQNNFMLNTVGNRVYRPYIQLLAGTPT